MYYRFNPCGDEHRYNPCECGNEVCDCLRCNPPCGCEENPCECVERLTAILRRNPRECGEEVCDCPRCNPCECDDEDFRCNPCECEEDFCNCPRCNPCECEDDLRYNPGFTFKGGKAISHEEEFDEMYKKIPPRRTKRWGQTRYNPFAW